MKKCISAMFLCGLMVISLAGCGSGGESTPSADNSLPSSSDGGSTGGTPATEVATPTEPASARIVSLAWEPPAGNIAGYNLYYGTSPGNYTNNLHVGLTPSYTLSGLSPGTYYFAVTANDSFGNESDYSNEISRAIN